MSSKKAIIFFVIALLLFMGIFSAFYAYKQFSKPIIKIEGKKTAIIYIPTGARYNDVLNILDNNQYLTDKKVFDFFAEKKKYKDNIKAGKFEIKDGLTVNELINILRSGNQKAVIVTFNNIRFLPKLASIVSKKLEFDSLELMSLLTNKEYIASLGYNENTIISLFLPNTYEFWWNTSADEFIKRMQKEHDKFWNKDRIQKAKNINLKPIEVSILASIVQEETNKTSEMSRIAGVYMNRLRVGMMLQADPTARFAYGDFSVKRVRYDYLKIDSPYNTYMYKGLPPGPICMPNPITIDKVLDYEKHKYYYFCAKADNSGTHVFEHNLRAHNRNARAYHRYLNKLKIRR
ncbi:MAG: endolytic transglycosylase MltG [Bacteroidetes bacterium]|nr:MAG: endolytic transglycosylase MltG [Bacteroidota bacterium]